MLNPIVDFANAFWAPTALLLGVACNVFVQLWPRFLPATHRAKRSAAPLSMLTGAQRSAPLVSLSQAILLSLATLGVTGVLLFAAGLLNVCAKLGLAAIITLVSTSWRRGINEINAALASQTKYLHSPPERSEKSLGALPPDAERSNIEISPREAAAKALNEGLIAPLFWLILLGFPGMAMYRMANSLCAQKEYPRAPRKHSRRGAEWLNLVLSYIPAWCTLLLLCIATGKPQAISTAWRKVRRKRDAEKNYWETLTEEIYRRQDDKFATADESCAKKDAPGGKKDAGKTDELTVITQVINWVSIMALGIAEGILIVRAVV